jgi:type IV pilus assembly protein PilY1
MTTYRKIIFLTLSTGVFFSLSAHGQLVISDTLTGASSSYNWTTKNGACLTAGNGSGTIPACVGLPYYSGKTQVGGVSGRLPDAVGQGALRLTNGDTTNGSNGNSQTGAVVSNFTFPSSEGVQVTFTTVTYGGNAYRNASGQLSGADGITFFLADGAEAVSVGAYGGSLGYSCSQGKNPADGVVGGYLGVGIDEYGNFSNPGDNTNTGPGARPGSITVRGAGNVNWPWLTRTYPSNFSGARNNATVQNICKNGQFTTGSDDAITPVAVLDYPFMATSPLPPTVPIYSQEAMNMPLRQNATPITYDLSITQAGILNLKYSVNGGTATPVITNQSIIEANGAVPATFRFGFSGGTGGGSNVHEITCFKAAQLNAASSSAGVNVQQSARVEAGTQVYLAYYHPTNWWGQLTATSLMYSALTDTVSFNSTANWDASCVLTGGSCAATGSTNTAQGSSSRNLLSWNGSAGIPLEWSNLSASQLSALGNTSELDYLRGGRTNEITPTGTTGYRARTGVLGDIINSSPTWVGPPSFPYKGPWRDLLNSAATMPEGTTYAAFVSSNATRTNVVYAGANDGFLHGFRAGAYNADGTFNASSTNDGNELLGYMPAAVSTTIHNSTSVLDFSSPQYTHAIFVDATPGTGDLYYAGAWHTWLVGGLGAGSNLSGPIGDQTSSATNSSIFAIDITNPSNFSETNAASLIVGEWSPSTLSCVSNIPANCGLNMGNTYGTPIIRRLHDGNWAVIFGNGLNSSTGKAGIFVMTIRQSDGNKSFHFLDTGSGPSGGLKNGIEYVASADLDGDHVTDYIYAGDVFGNIWRFDLTNSDPTNWAADSSPLFTTPTGQPITTKVTVSSAIAKIGNPRILIAFGTGQKLPQTATSAATYATGTSQSLYGIWDWNMNTWNSKGSTQYASLTGPQTLNTSVLQSQIATNVTGSSGNISGYRTVTMNAVCWSGSSTCTAGNTQFGWRLTLPTSSEQVIYSPTTAYGLFLVNTTIPAVNNVLTCDNQPSSGYTMAINIDSGGSPTKSFFADATNNYVSSSGQVVSGIGLSATGTPSFVSAHKKSYMINQTSTGVGSITQVNPGANGIGKRVSWIKLR